jgi:spatacsin
MFSCGISRSLNKLVDVNLAEEGVMRLLFASVYQIFVRVGSENEFVLASRY